MTSKKILRTLLPVVIIAFGILGMRMLLSMRPVPEKEARPEQITTVDVLTVQRSEQIAQVLATGVVEASRQVTLAPEVSGRVTWMASSLVPGGRVKKGQSLLRVDPRDYELAVAQQGAAVEQANLNLELELSQQGVRKKEWELLGKDLLGGGAGKKAPTISPLALREPQVKAAQVAVKSALSGLRRSELGLERTLLRAPFNAMVVTEQVEVGQVAAPGAPVATLIGTDRFWITAQVPVERLVYIELASSGGPGSEVLITQDLGAEGVLVKRGHALRLKGGLDPATRTAQVVIGVEHPLDPEPAAVGVAALPLLPGAFVRVAIDGKKVEQTFALPRTAVFEGNRVWTVDENDRLRSLEVSIAWRTGDMLFVRDGLSEGQRVVISLMALPIEGMRVDVATMATPKAGG